MPYVVGRLVPGICDRCGFRYLLSQLKYETVAGVKGGSRVCPSCWDADHPQNFSGRSVAVDAQAVRDPRPRVEDEG